MELSHYSSSKAYFDLFEEIERPVICRWNSIGGRIAALKILLEVLLVLPFGLCYKAYKTFLRTIGLFLSGSFLFLTLGSSNTAREFFVERVSSVARDLSDWILLPFALFSCLFRLFFSLVVHPAFFLRF